MWGRAPSARTHSRLGPVHVHSSEVNRTSAGRQAANPIGAITSTRPQPCSNAIPSKTLVRPYTAARNWRVYASQPVISNSTRLSPRALAARCLLLSCAFISSLCRARLLCVSPHIPEFEQLSAPLPLNLDLWRKSELTTKPADHSSPGARLRA
jgi:hypothetical protein